MVPFLMGRCAPGCGTRCWGQLDGCGEAIGHIEEGGDGGDIPNRALAEAGLPEGVPVFVVHAVRG